MSPHGVPPRPPVPPPGTGLWRDSLVAPSNAILLVGSAVCVLSAPPTIRYVNDVTGVANFSAPLVYAGMTALSASYLVLMIRWKGGPPETQQRAARLVLGVYALVIAGIWVLFGLAEVPVERTQDLDTYYADTPCIGLTFDAGYQIAKYTAVAARWNGVDWDFLSTDVSPALVMLAGVTTAAGFAVPRVGRAPTEGLIRWWDPPVVRLARREIAIWDGVPACAPCLDDQVRTTAYAEAVASLAADGTPGIRSPHQATVVAEAAMPAAACVQVLHDGRAEVPARAGTLESISQPQRMVLLSRALSSSPIVARARRQAAARTAAGRD
ncbi:hypothetical protein [Streptomyces mirabilis]|uniref:hypothetical protein n=1 Tax=Streptomyces mirabilis TaxID=68239 RepID=UPI0036AFEF85